MPDDALARRALRLRAARYMLDTYRATLTGHAAGASASGSGGGASSSAAAAAGGSDGGIPGTAFVTENGADFFATEHGDFFVQE